MEIEITETKSAKESRFLINVSTIQIIRSHFIEILHSDSITIKCNKMKISFIEYFS